MSKSALVRASREPSHKPWEAPVPSTFDRPSIVPARTVSLRRRGILPQYPAIIPFQWIQETSLGRFGDGLFHTKVSSINTRYQRQPYHFRACRKHVSSSEPNLCHIPEIVAKPTVAATRGDRERVPTYAVRGRKEEIRLPPAAPQVSEHSPTRYTQASPTQDSRRVRPAEHGRCGNRPVHRGLSVLYELQVSLP